MNGWAGTRAEREWLAALRKIGNALERIATQMEQRRDEDTPKGPGDDGPTERGGER